MTFRQSLILAAALALVAGTAPSLAQDTDADPGAACDRLAANPEDPDRTVPGVALDDIDPAAAETACRAAVAAHPDERRYRYELGRVLHGKSDLAGAVAAYEDAAAAGSAAAYFGLGVIYIDGVLTDVDEAKAVAYLRKAVDLGSPAAEGLLGELTEQGVDGAPPDFDAAVALYRKAIEDGHAGSLVDLAWAYSDGHGVPMDKAEAERLLRQAIAGPDPVAANDGLNALAWIMVTGDDRLDEAEGLAAKAIARWPDRDATGKANAYDTHALILHKLGRDPEALADATRAVTLDDTVAGFFDHQGDIYAALGQKDEARTAWQHALDVEPPDAYVDPDWNPKAVQAKIDALDE